MNFVKKLYGVNLTVSIIFLIFGLVLFFKPETTITLISNIIGIILLIMGASSIYKYTKEKHEMDVIYGSICGVAGIILILNPTAVVSILPFILGVYFLISGIYKIKYAFDVRKYNGTNFKALFIIAILVTLCGALFIVNPFSGAVAITQIIGVFLIVYSVLDIINFITMKKDVNIVTEVTEIEVIKK